MITSLRFRQHERFHRAALFMVGAGAAAGLVAALLPGVNAATTLAFLAAAAVVGSAAAQGELRPASLASRFLLIALGGGAMLLLGRQGHTGAALASFSVLAAAALCWGLRGRRLLAAVIAGAGLMALAAIAHTSVMTASELSSLPAWSVTLIAGATFAVVSVLAVVPRHIDIVIDPVANAYAGLRGNVGGEIGELVERGHGVWTKAAGELDNEDANRQLLEEAVLRLFDTARRWNSSDAEASQTSAASLVERMESLDDRIKGTDDEVVKEQYAQARAALAEQLKYIKGISTNRDRVLARMHNYLAAMERLRLAVVNLKSASASREAVDLAPIISNLEELGQDIDECSVALAEIDDTSRPAATPEPETPASDADKS